MLQFDEWLAGIAAEEDTGFVEGQLPARWLTWMQETFAQWGALSPQDLKALAQIEQDRLAAEGLEQARKLVPAVVADGHAVGMELDVELRLTEWGTLEARVCYEPGQGYSWASNGGIRLPADGDAELLAALAGEIQEPTMERDQVHVFVWPVCSHHQRGGHAEVADGVAVWVCSGAGGHVMAPIGALSTLTDELY